MKRSISIRPPSFTLRRTTLPVSLQPALAGQQPSPPPSTAPSQSTPVGDQPLIIANGRFSKDGKEMPATLRNVLDVVRLRYPTSNITAIGVDHLIIEQLTLN